MVSRGPCLTQDIQAVGNPSSRLIHKSVGMQVSTPIFQPRSYGQKRCPGVARRSEIYLSFPKHNTASPWTASKVGSGPDYGQAILVRLELAPKKNTCGKRASKSFSAYRVASVECHYGEAILQVMKDIQLTPWSRFEWLGQVPQLLAGPPWLCLQKHCECMAVQYVVYSSTQSWWGPKQYHL